jgi:RNA polymerase sigma-70 factor (family 1)
MVRENEHKDFIISINDEGSNSPAFSEIFRQYYSTLCYFAERIIGDSSSTEDIVEEVFLKVWNKSEPFESSKHLKYFLYQSTRNACLDEIKKTRHAKERQLIYLNEDMEDTVPYINEIIHAEVIREIYQAIKELPEQCGRIITMSYIDGLNNDEIANKLGLSVQTVKNQKSRGISLLKIRLSSELFCYFLLLNIIR